VILVLDLNSYFASVEQQLHPPFRGKALAVVPSLTDHTSCIAASYEAKAFGVKTGTRVGDAKRMCPGIILVDGDHSKYIEYHHRIAAAIGECLPISETLSIDEFSCELIGREREKENALALARKIKERIYERVGTQIRCSIGIAPNRLLAKMASDRIKPNGLVWWGPECLPGVLETLRLQDIPGIGAAMEKRLLRGGVGSMRDLLALDSTQIRKAWGGIHADYYFRSLRGEVFDPVETARRSVSQSHVLPPRLRTLPGAWAVAQKLLHKAAARLRKLGYYTSSMHVSVRFQNGARFLESLNFLEAQDNLSLLEALKHLWKSEQMEALGVPMKVSVWFHDLIPEAQHSVNFFEDERRGKLSKTLDAIEKKFGRNSLYFAGVDGAKESAPVRIAFTNIPDL
jgi:DNA polymerase-4